MLGVMLGFVVGAALVLVGMYVGYKIGRGEW